MGNFYQGKLGYAQLRWFYFNYSNRSIENFFIATGIFDIADDEEFLLKVLRFTKGVIGFIDKNSLPAEKMFFQHRDVKMVDMLFSVKKYLKRVPSKKTILTSLDYNNILGDSFFRYMTNRLFFAQVEEAPTREDAMISLDTMLISINPPEDLTEEIKELKREFDVKSQMVRYIINKDKANKASVKVSNEKTLETLKSKINVIDSKTDLMIKELDDELDKLLESHEQEVEKLVNEHNNKIDDMNRRLSEFKDKSVKQIKEITNLVKKISVPDEVSVDEVLKSLTYLEMICNQKFVPVDNVKLILNQNKKTLKSVSKILNQVDALGELDLDTDETLVILQGIEEKIDGNLSSYLSEINSFRSSMAKAIRLIDSKVSSLERRASTTVSNYSRLKSNLLGGDNIDEDIKG